MQDPSSGLDPTSCTSTITTFVSRHHAQRNLDKCTNCHGLLPTLLGGISGHRGHTERKSIMQPLFGGKALADFSTTTMDRRIEPLHARLMTTPPTPRQCYPPT